MWEHRGEKINSQKESRRPRGHGLWAAGLEDPRLRSGIQTNFVCVEKIKAGEEFREDLCTCVVYVIYKQIKIGPPKVESKQSC